MSNGALSATLVLLQKWEINIYIPLPSPEVKTFLPHYHVVSGNQRSGAGDSLAAVAWGLKNITGLLAWPQLMPIPAPAHLQVAGTP